jgi:hypothetical protein
MAAISGRHSAQLVFQSASVLIADLVCHRRGTARMAGRMQIRRFCVA